MSEQKLINTIEENLKLLNEHNKISLPKDLEKKWQLLVSNEPRRFINPDLTIKREVLKNFRKTIVFISDMPTYSCSIFNLKNFLSGSRRGNLKLLKECFGILKKNGHEYLLRKYPINLVGNPYYFDYKNTRFSYRWIKHIHSLGLFKDQLEKKVGDDFTILDVGSSYGIFSYLLRKEFPASSNILLDFPEQLVLAHYFLGTNFPDAKIASFKEIKDASRITKSFIKEFDFILLPYFLYDKLEPNSIDVLTNFISFAEMKRKWFDYYLKQEPFLSCKHFFTINRFQSAPEYDTDLTILDYPLDDFQKLHFGVWQIPSYCYGSNLLFFSEKIVFSSQCFEFIGERKTESKR